MLKALGMSSLVFAAHVLAQLPPGVDKIRGVNVSSRPPSPLHVLPVLNVLSTSVYIAWQLVCGRAVYDAGLLCALLTLTPPYQS